MQKPELPSQTYIRTHAPIKPTHAVCPSEDWPPPRPSTPARTHPAPHAHASPPVSSAAMARRGQARGLEESVLCFSRSANGPATGPPCGCPNAAAQTRLPERGCPNAAAQTRLPKRRCPNAAAQTLLPKR
eukprot:213619-Chlamydomonas_euryale.AAC.1